MSFICKVAFAVIFLIILTIVTNYEFTKLKLFLLFDAEQTVQSSTTVKDKTTAVGESVSQDLNFCRTVFLLINHPNNRLLSDWLKQPFTGTSQLLPTWKIAWSHLYHPLTFHDNEIIICSIFVLFQSCQGTPRKSMNICELHLILPCKISDLL